MKEKIIKVVPLLVFIVLLVSTFIAWKITQDVVKTEVRQNFNQEVQVVKHWVQDRLNLYLPIALGIRIFFESSDNVNASEWSRYIQRLKLINKYSAISSITYVERTRGKNRDAYLVKYIEPLDKNKKNIGLDQSLNQKQLELLNSIRDEDPTSTGRVVLITSPIKGFEIILPVYQKGSAPITVKQRREALKGFIQVKFAGNKLFRDIFNVVDTINFDFEIYSGSLSKENLLYGQDDYSILNPNYQPEMVTRDTFIFNKQTWRLVVASKPDFKLTPSQERLPLVVLGSGLFFSFIYLGSYLYMKKQNEISS